ncbi:MAG TPA: trypsin-like peptidase domain-containing protein [Dehalococcoidia bacterium]|nr:trypsin-like peptidase domain-containing protein [Dehalococcoidia bacterium]
MPLAMLAGCALALAAMFTYLQLDPQEGRYDDADIRRLASEQIASVTPSPPIEPQVYALVRPAVVLITKEQNALGPNPSRGLGAGVVFDLNGSILTAYHVVAGADTVTVRFHDGTTTTGTVTQKQPERDLAVVQVARLPNSVQPAVLGGGVSQGTRVMAIGAPFGLEGSASLGIVSGLNRRFTVEETGQVLDNMIQFDAAVNPGNSGGPLVNMNGQVVGIVTGIINPTGSSVFIGLGFAVPIQAASGIVAPVD